MKKLVLLSVAFMLTGLTMKAQWSQSSVGVRISRSVSVANDDVIWISDPAYTTFSLTTDGGSTWITKGLPSGIANNHGVLSAVSATTAYIIGNPGGSGNGIYKTTDSGDSWIQQATGFTKNSPFPDFVYFWNENDGVAVGDAYPNPDFEIYTTNNGGDQWEEVPAANMPPGNNGWSYNSISDAFRVHGDTIYFLAIDLSEVRIFKSTNKGLNWTVINTPFINNGSFNWGGTFDFQNNNNGLFCVRGPVSDSIYSTVDGGQNWTLINLLPFQGSYLIYIPSVNAYFSPSPSYGGALLYSTDNGQSWTFHPSFFNVPLYGVGYTPSGRIFMSGINYVYSTTNYDYDVTNLSVLEAQITGSRNIDITFSDNVELLSSEDTTNYGVIYNPGEAFEKIKVESVTRDNENSSLVHLITYNALPIDTIYISVKNVTDIYGFPIINGSAVATAFVIYSEINHLPGKAINVFPNPANNLLNVNNIPQKSIICVFDMYGKMIINKRPAKINEILNLGTLNSGIYIIRIENSRGLVTQKFVKE